MPGQRQSCICQLLQRHDFPSLNYPPAFIISLAATATARERFLLDDSCSLRFGLSGAGSSYRPAKSCSGPSGTDAPPSSTGLSAGVMPRSVFAAEASRRELEAKKAADAAAAAAAARAEDRASTGRVELTERFYARPADLFHCFTHPGRVQAFTQSAAQARALRLWTACLCLEALSERGAAGLLCGGTARGPPTRPERWESLLPCHTSETNPVRLCLSNWWQYN